MTSITRGKLLAVSALLLIPFCASADTDNMGPFDDTILVRAGLMYANQNTQLRLNGDTNIGIGVDLEDFFGLEEELTHVAQFLVQGRIAERHRIGLEYYTFNREADAVLQQDWSGDDIEASAGAISDTTLNIGITDISYAYSMIRDDKHELAATFGLFWMDIDVAIDLQGQLSISGQPTSGGSASADARLAAPLPLIGLNYSYAINPRWLLGTSFKYFALHTSKLDGSIVMFNVDTRYYLWDHFEVGAGFTLFDLGVDVDMGDLNGDIDWSFWGPQLFIGARF